MKNLNVLQQFHLLKTRLEHYHIGLFTSLGDVSLIKENHCFQLISRILVIILSILTCSFFIILYSLEWGAQRANEWLITMILSFGQSILVIDPVKVFLITAIISFLIRRPYNDETLDFNDPFMGALLSQNTVENIDDQQLYNSAKVKGLSDDSHA